MAEQVRSALEPAARLSSFVKESLASTVAFAEAAEREIAQLAEAGRVREARESLQHALAVSPQSAGLKEWQKVLAPPMVRRVKGARTPSRQREREWLKLHASEHRGQWVALVGNRLLAAGPAFADVVAEARRKGEAASALVHFVPRPRGSSDA
jgi:hypothetical protein